MDLHEFVELANKVETQKSESAFAELEAYVNENALMNNERSSLLILRETSISMAQWSVLVELYRDRQGQPRVSYKAFRAVMEEDIPQAQILVQGGGYE